MLTSPLRPSDPTPGSGPLSVDEDLDRPDRPVRQVHVAVRQRRVLFALSGVTGLAVLVAAMTGTVALWGLAAVSTVLAVTYLALIHRVRRLAVEREMASAFGHHDVAGWTALDQGMALTDTSEPVEAGVRRGELARFVVASLLGVVLTPLVMLIQAVGGDTSQLRRSRLAGAILRAHEYGRSQSMRVLTVSVAATAGVTGLGAAFASSATAAPVAAASPLSQHATAAGSSYTVQPGDTLSAIAAKYGVSYTSLAQANGISNPDQISVGETITVPSGGGGSYTVQPGDTLSAIAARYGVSYASLAQTNNIANPDQIAVGQVLQVPSGGSSSPSPAPSSPPPSSSPSMGSAGSSVPQSGSTASSPAQTAVNTAEAQIGKPYVYGGAGPDSYDCSGLTMYAWAAAGVQLPHYTVSQMQDTTPISQSDLQPGDLVFYGGAQPYHVAMYIGNGQVVAADNYNLPVQNQSIDYVGTPSSFGRVG